MKQAMADMTVATLLNKLTDGDGGGDLPAVEEDNSGERVLTMHNLADSLFAAVAAFRAAYFHLQTAHAPFDAAEISAADRSAVAQLRLLSRLKYSDPDALHLAVGDVRADENQSMLRALDLAVNRLQHEFETRSGEIATIRRRRDELDGCNIRLEKRMAAFDASAASELILSVGLFNSLLQDVCRSARLFTQLLVRKMKKSDTDLSLAANLIHPGIGYARIEHNRYAFLSFVCLSMLGGFNLENFGLIEDDTGIASQDLSFHTKRRKLLMEFVEHGSVHPLDLLASNPDCDFGRFCSERYKNLMSSTKKFCLFGELGMDEILFEVFVNMVSLVWMLHKLAFAFDPRVEIFQVKRGANFSIVYMEDVCRKKLICSGFEKVRREVGFTVIPGFKVGKTVIQSRVYLNNSKHELVVAKMDGI